VYGNNNVMSNFTTAERKVYNNGFYASVDYDYLTGCGPKASKSDEYSTTCNKYTTAIGQEASTTGNAYGIYDMAGGINELTQANRGAISDTTITATMPQTRYLDIYYVTPFGVQPTGSNSNEYNYNFDVCTYNTCGGHGLFEERTNQSVSDNTQSWGSDVSTFMASTHLWSSRSGGVQEGSEAGLWYSGNNGGNSGDTALGFRVVAQNINKAISITAQEKPPESDGSVTNFVSDDSFTVPEDGTYKLEVWGARGGGYSGGSGGYSVGTVNLTAGELILVRIGGNGYDGGGGNGGGQGGTLPNYGGGGTDMRIGGADLYNRIIVAGGGGAGACTTGGAGGGLSGGAGGSYGGTQISGGAGSIFSGGGDGSFGSGGGGTHLEDSGNDIVVDLGGGGGWYGGGGGYLHDDREVDACIGISAGGGSGYVFTSGSNKSGYGSNVPSDSYYLTNASTTDSQWFGSGRARITKM
jgi:hypothetical protein